MYERSSFANEVGAAINVGPNAMRVLRGLGFNVARARFLKTQEVYLFLVVRYFFFFFPLLTEKTGSTGQRLHPGNHLPLRLQGLWVQIPCTLVLRTPGRLAQWAQTSCVGRIRQASEGKIASCQTSGRRRLRERSVEIRRRELSPQGCHCGRRWDSCSCKISYHIKNPASTDTFSLSSFDVC